MDKTSKMIILSDLARGKISALDALVEERKDPKTMREFCKVNKYALLYADNSLQLNPEFVARNCKEDYTFAFWICNNAKYPAKLEELRKVASNIYAFERCPREFFDDDIFVKSLQEVVRYSITAKHKNCQRLIDQVMTKLQIKINSSIGYVISEYNKIVPEQQRISQILHDIGLQSHLQGYQTIYDMIALGLKDKIYIQKFRTGGYRAIIKKYPEEHLEETTIGSRIRNAIISIHKKSSKKANERLGKNLFGGDKPPKSKLFLTTILQKLEEEKHPSIPETDYTIK